MADLVALIFDFDGTIAETERDGHRVAYNAAFDESGVGWNWDVPTYGALLAIAGGKERLAYFLAHEHPEIDVGKRADLVAHLHERKRTYFDGIADRLAFRPGVRRLIAEARAAGIRCAIATTAAPSGVDALLRRDPVFAASFECIVAGDMVANKKPAPDIYLLALERLAVAADAAVAFEDSAVGLRSARAANIATIVTPSVYTSDENFHGAACIVSHLGETDEAAHVLSGPPMLGQTIDLAYVRSLVSCGPARST